MPISATASGLFTLRDGRAIHRLGFGAMRLTGPGIWGLPQDLEQAKATLRRVPELGIDFVDTADSYGPEVSENLLREVLHPYRGLLIATKGGLVRTGPDGWSPLGRPEYLRQCVLMSLRRLGVDRIDLWQLHRIDPTVPRGEQLDVIAQMRKEGLIDRVGLSEVSVADIEAAEKHFPVTTVQSEFNLIERKNEPVLDYCEENGIGFIPWFPLAAGKLTDPSSVMVEIAKRLEATPAQVALAWTLKRSQVMLPIPGTSKVKHLEENVTAAHLRLSDEDFAALDRQGRALAGPRPQRLASQARLRVARAFLRLGHRLERRPA
jgi:aryl-alcohol dehydrogenase-like predicted oxidoreductase